MAGVKVDIDQKSLKNVLSKLNSIDKQMTPAPRTYLSMALNEAGLEVAKEIKKAPADVMPVITGRLRSSIHPKMRPSESFMYTDKHGKVFTGSLQTPIQEGKEVIVGTNVEYAGKVNERRGFMAYGERASEKILKDKIAKYTKKAVQGK